MCEVCEQVPCANRCPNGSKISPIVKCCECGSGIYEGETYYEAGDGSSVCEGCLEDMNYDEIFGLLGEQLKVAEVA